MIRLESVGKAYGDRVVLDDLSLEVGAGEIYGLVGPNGAGKSTAINIICGLLDPDAGRVEVAGVSSSEAARRRLGVVQQETAVYEQLTCRENLDLFARLYGLNRSRRQGAIAALIDRLHLAPYADAVVARLSGGWQRRVHIAAALVHSPTALILDEPTAGLDVEARRQLWAAIERLRAAATAILLTTHDLVEAERLCTRLGILSRGRVVAEGTMDELRASFPAAQLAEVETADEETLRGIVATRGWWVAGDGGRFTLGLGQHSAFEDVAAQLQPCRLTSLRLREVSLEDVYLERTAA
jgi:ABC-2 type transport system ATP-binding protein